MKKLNKQDKKRMINNRLKEDYDYLINNGYTVVGIFLQGSQNYELDYENSDIDTKAIIVPSLKDIILNKKPVSTTYVKKDNSHVDIKDIRLMFDCFKKQNINFIEVLFTKYKYLNPELEELYKPMLDNNELIAHYNNYAAVNCIVGMMFEKNVALCHRYEGLAEKIDKYGYDSKQLHHILRCYEFLNRYIKGEPYKDCLISKQKDLLIKIKSNNAYYNKDEAVKIAQETCDKAKEIKNDYMENTPLKVNTDVEELMQKVLIDIMTYCLKKELKESNV